ncbi:MAG: FG-GAP repeat protein, partial [Deltaproteobacteria bacterium]|nr:FG-GAP repeat protein [Nannocystaceae bacterium]
MTNHLHLCALALLAVFGCAGSSEPSATFVAPRLGLELVGEVANEWLGYSIAAAGDVTGDGRADLLLSEHASGVGGRVSVIAGPLVPGEPWRDRVVATFVGEYGFANLGDWLVHAGGCDVNGDGHADLLLGSPFADVDDVAATPIRSGDNAGKAYLVFGGPALAGDHGITDADVQLVGEAAFDTAGSAVACLGDLDGDGRDDVAIAAKGSAHSGAQDAGAVYVLYGRDTWPTILALADADAILMGEQAYEQAGIAVSPAGDVDGDGHVDVLIGAPNADVDGEDDGVAYLVLGDGQRLAGELPLASRAVRLE